MTADLYTLRQPDTQVSPHLGGSRPLTQVEDINRRWGLYE